jgi:hypothetical protein
MESARLDQLPCFRPVVRGCHNRKDEQGASRGDLLKKTPHGRTAVRRFFLTTAVLAADRAINADTGLLNELGHVSTRAPCDSALGGQK